MEPVGYLFIEWLSTSVRERTLGYAFGAERSRACQGYHKAREHLTSVRQSITPMVSTPIARQCDPCPTSSRLVSASTRIRGRHTAFSPPAGDGVTTARSSRTRLLPLPLRDQWPRCEPSLGRFGPRE